MARNRKGFTLVEVVVVLVVLAILAAILIPALTGWIDESKREICVSNRSQLLRYYRYEGTLYYLEDRKDLTLANLLAGTFPESEGDVKSLTCPSGGRYTAIGDTAILCDVHGLEGDGFNAYTALSAALKQITNAADKTGSYDSTAPDIWYGDAGKPSFKARLLDAVPGLRDAMEASGVKSWSIRPNDTGEKGGRSYIWTDQDITNLPLGSYVRVIRYTTGYNNYTVGYTKVTSSNNTGDNFAKLGNYNVIGLNDWIIPKATDTSAATKDSYEASLAEFLKLEQQPASTPG